MRTGLLAWVCVLAATVATAQAPVNDPTTVQFTPPADYAATTSDGQPVVVRCDLQIYLTSQPDVSYRIINLGKPAPAADGTITVVFSGLTPYPLPDGEYQARVVAWRQVDPGPGVSGPSNVFTFGAPPPVGGPPPMKPTGITVKVQGE